MYDYVITVLHTLGLFQFNAILGTKLTLFYLKLSSLSYSDFSCTSALKINLIGQKIWFFTLDFLGYLEYSLKTVFY